MVHSNITVITSTNIFNDMPEMWIRLWKLLLNFGRVLVGNNIEKWFSHWNMLTVCLIWWFWKLQFNKEINFIENIQSKEFILIIQTWPLSKLFIVCSNSFCDYSTTLLFVLEKFIINECLIFIAFYVLEINDLENVMIFIIILFK